MREGAGTSRDYPNILDRYLGVLSRILKTAIGHYLPLQARKQALPALAARMLPAGNMKACTCC
ncbi:hypothetical protein RKD54_000926 [Pseudarthrobacter sp. SLBN-100]